MNLRIMIYMSFPEMPPRILCGFLQQLLLTGRWVIICVAVISAFAYAAYASILVALRGGAEFQSNRDFVGRYRVQKGNYGYDLDIPRMTCIYTYIYTQIYIYIYMYVYIYVYMYVFVCICLYLYVFA